MILSFAMQDFPVSAAVRQQQASAYEGKQGSRENVAAQ
jgi:hypothetical protein